MPTPHRKSFNLTRIGWLFTGIYSLIWYERMLEHPASHLEQPGNQLLTLGLVITLYVCYWLNRKA